MLRTPSVLAWDVRAWKAAAQMAFAAQSVLFTAAVWLLKCAIRRHRKRGEL